jgi:hypothetical protein
VTDIVDVKQIVYALERARDALKRQADKLGAQGDYSAEFPAEDADRMTEAIALLQLHPVTEAPHDWEQAYHAFKTGPRFKPDEPALKIAFAAGMEWQIMRERAIKEFESATRAT